MIKMLRPSDLQYKKEENNTTSCVWTLQTTMIGMDFTITKDIHKKTFIRIL